MQGTGFHFDATVVDAHGRPRHRERVGNMLHHEGHRALLQRMFADETPPDFGEAFRIGLDARGVPTGGDPVQYEHPDGAPPTQPQDTLAQLYGEGGFISEYLSQYPQTGGGGYARQIATFTLAAVGHGYHVETPYYLFRNAVDWLPRVADTDEPAPFYHNVEPPGSIQAWQNTVGYPYQQPKFRGDAPNWHADLTTDPWKLSFLMLYGIFLLVAVAGQFKLLSTGRMRKPVKVAPGEYVRVRAGARLAVA